LVMSSRRLAPPIQQDGPLQIWDWA
jgi:hypothetical protein